jgi:arsenical pump membrane protein
MLVVVQGVENLGLTAGFGRWLVDLSGGLSGGQSWGAVFASVFGAAIGSNAINNVPMALVLISSIQSAVPPGPTQDLFVYGTIMGADLGPNITTVGSLATMLWLLILRRKGMEASSMAYFKLGITVTPLLLVLGALALWLSSLAR